MPASMRAYPLTWRLLDAAEALAATLWPQRFARATGWLLLLPSLLLVGILVAGLAILGDASLRLLDTETFELSAHYTLANYRELLDKSHYAAVLRRSTLGAIVVTVATLLLAFPYAYVMVRTRSAWTRKLLLVSLFLPFFIGQVVRAYGWLVILGREGIVNRLVGLAGVGPFELLYTYPSVLFGLIQYMLPFAVLLIAPAVTAIDEEIELASATLGASWPRTFLHVTLPLAKPGLVAAALVVFTLTITDYAMPLVLGGGTNDFIANAVYDAFFRISDNGLGSAVTIVLVMFATTLAGIILTVLGAGTLGMRRT
jgi:putative spermidine/putrescine transport system permease protein